MNKLTTATLVLTAFGLASTVASAATVTATSGDLILGFEVPAGNTGSSTDLEVDLGSYSQFTPTTQKFTLTQLSVNDLMSTFGSGFATDIEFSVAGILPGTDASTPDFYATSTTVPKQSNTQGLDGPYGFIENLAPGLNGQASTANSSSAADIGTSSSPASADSESFTSLVSTSGYGAFLPATEQTGAGSNELYSFFPSAKGAGKSGTYPAATDIGTFSLSSNGVLTFTGSAAAVPEPSTWAMMAGAAGLLFLAMRRRNSIIG